MVSKGTRKRRCQARAIKQVVLVLKDPLDREYLTTMPLFVCSSHARALGPDDVLTDRSFARIKQRFIGLHMVPPVRRKSEIRFGVL